MSDLAISCTGSIDTDSTRTWETRLLTVLWAWLSFRTLLPWLVSHRLALEGDSYSWGTEYFGHMFHSAGLARPDALLVFALLGIHLALLQLLRSGEFRVAAPAVTGLLGIFAADAVYELVAGEPVIFRGDTLDVTLNVTPMFFSLQFGLFALALAWWFGVRDLPRVPRARPLSISRRRLLLAALALFPIQITLLVVGEPHALTDEIGVLMTLSQWVILACVLYPGAGYREHCSTAA
jgi:hypothetical protein